MHERLYSYRFPDSLELTWFSSEREASSIVVAAVALAVGVEEGVLTRNAGIDW